jgi:hypothetical protein
VNLRRYGVECLKPVEAVALGWLLIVFFFYFERPPKSFDFQSLALPRASTMAFPPVYWWKVAGGLVTALWIIWIILKSGGQLLAKLLPEADLSDLEKTIFSAGLGFGILSLLTEMLGAVQLWYVSVFWCALLLATIAYFPRNLPRFNSGILLGSWHRPEARWISFANVLLVATGLIFLIGSLCPEIFYDALHYHLAVPNLYLLNHGIYDEPNFAYASLVMAVQMSWGFALTVGNEISVKLLNVSAAILLSLIFVAFERRFCSRHAGVFGTLCFLSMPVAGFKVMTAGVDIAWTALQVLAAFALIRALTYDGEESVGLKWLRLAGILTGLAASCKYNSLAAIPIGSVMIAWKKWPQRQRDWWPLFKHLRVFTVYVCIVLLPFFFKNAVFRHNPIYPVAGTFWGTPRLTDDGRKAMELLSPKLSQQFSSFSSSIRFVFHPWFNTIEGRSDQNFIGPVLLALLPLVVFARPPDLATGLLACYSLGMWLSWLLTTGVVRYNMPALAMVSLLGAHSLLSLPVASAVRGAILTLSLVAIGSNIYWTAYIQRLNEGWQVLAGAVSEQDYLKESHMTYPTPDYEGLDWMNRHLPPGSKVMMAGDSRSYYTRIPLIPSSIVNPQPLLEIARKAHTGLDMVRLLRERGVTHLFVNTAEALRTEAYRPFPWDQSTWTVLDAFWSQHVRLLWTNTNAIEIHPAGLFVYEIDPDPTSMAPPPNPFEFWKPK